MKTIYFIIIVLGGLYALYNYQQMKNLQKYDANIINKIMKEGKKYKSIKNIEMPSKESYLNEYGDDFEYKNDISEILKKKHYSEFAYRELYNLLNKQLKNNAKNYKIRKISCILSISIVVLSILSII